MAFASPVTFRARRGLPFRTGQKPQDELPEIRMSYGGRGGGGRGPDDDDEQRDLFVPIFVATAIMGYTLILAWDLAKSWGFLAS